jgi:hypothetical protein
MAFDLMEQAGNIIEKALMPEGNPERIIFRRFPGDKLKSAAASGTELDPKQIDTVILRINPESVSFSKRKVIQKVQTSAPGRFVVFDWGSELTVMNIAGNTGNLLPEAITAGTNPLSETLISAAAPVFGSERAAGLGSTLGIDQVQDYLQDILIANSTYFELLEMSPKFKTFKRLEKMFDLVDVDRDILTLEFGSDNIYRGFFEDFSFSIEATMPWNWKYNIVFVILNDLNAKITRWDEQYSETNPNIITAVEEESL